MAMNNRLLRPLASGFNPRSLASLDLWFDASDTSSVTVSTGVSVWANKSGLSGRNMTQGTGNNQPAYTPSYLNGKHAIVFDGSNDTLSCTSATLTNPYHSFFVMKHTSAYATTKRFTGADANGQAFSGARTSSTDMVMLNGSPFGSVGGTPAVEPETFSVIEFEINGASSVARCNGTAFGAITGTVGTVNPGGLVLGGSIALAQYSAIAVAELIVYSRVLTATERAKVSNALRSKWGV